MHLFAARSVYRLFTAVAVMLALAACVPQNDGPRQSSADGSYGLQGFNPASEEAREASCLAQGGNFRAAGLADIKICVLTSKDAGKYCTASDQCDSSCLSRSNTCAPIKPLFGCNSILDNSGREVTLCRD